MPAPIQIHPDASKFTLGIALSKYHRWATDRLLEGAIQRFKRLGGDAEARLLIAPAAGAWELPAIARALCQNPSIDGVVALGVVIQGETSHFEYICQGVTQGLTTLTTKTGTPIGFGVLTCQTTAEVEARCGGSVGNKGAEAVQAVIESLQAIQSISKFRFETESEGEANGNA